MALFPAEVAQVDYKHADPKLLVVVEDFLAVVLAPMVANGLVKVGRVSHWVG